MTSACAADLKKNDLKVTVSDFGDDRVGTTELIIKLKLKLVER